MAFGRTSSQCSRSTARLHAIDAILEDEGELPCNIKFIIEGEEETGQRGYGPTELDAIEDLLALYGDDEGDQS